MPSPGGASRRVGTHRLKTLALRVRAVVLWIASGLHFFLLSPVFLLLGLWIDPRQNDRPLRWFFRNVLRVAGVGFEVRWAPGFDPHRTCLFVANHVNLFDPFVLFSAIPQPVRGIELESHFRIPGYGWMAKRFGNIPVQKNASPAQLRQLWRRTRAALDSGLSLVVFPEGGRTRDGHVGPFHDGAFRMAIEFGYPIVPVSITGSFEFNRKGDWMLYPSTIVVYLHDLIETTGMTKADVPALRDRVRQIIAETVERSLRQPLPA